MPKVTYEILKQRQKKYIKAYAGICLVLLAVVGYFSYVKWTDYSEIKDGIGSNRVLAESLKDDVTNAKAELEYQKDEFEGLNKEIEKKLSSLFPEEDDYTAITRLMDVVEDDLSSKNNPFEISNINFQGTSAADDYSVLPFSMNIRGSAENFEKFLHFVENSGALDGEVRLMDISSIRLSFGEKDEETGRSIINFTVQINAYFQSK